jgi:predicted RNase H-like nuclease
MTTWVAGVDGCRSGWVSVRHPLGQPSLATVQIHDTFRDILDLAENPQFIAVDMPIGLPKLGTRGGRPADVEARKVLGQRQSSVFAVPARSAVMCEDYREACQVALEHSDPPRKVSKQTFNLFPKIREVDHLMTPELQDRIFEVHPEAAFWALNGCKPLELPKKVKSRPFADGMNERKKLLSAVGYDLSIIDHQQFARSDAGEDDILDAFAAAWSATRIATGTAKRFPANPGVDASGLRMEIWC